LNTASATEIFESLYGAGITHDPALQAALSQAPVKQLAIGDSLPAQLVQADEVAVLVSGKIRVLGRLNPESPSQTVTSLVTGSICSANQLNQPNLEFRVSSDEAVIYILPASCVMQNPVLAEQAQSAFLDQQASSFSLGASHNMVGDAFTITENDQERIPVPALINHREVFSDQAWYCLQAIEEYYRGKHGNSDTSQYFKAGESRQGLGVRRKLLTMRGFLAKLKDLRYQIRTLHATWPQLLNSQIPFVVHDQTGMLHWVTGRQGNDLIEISNGIETYFSIPNPDIHMTYEVLFLQPLRKRAGALEFKPFSLLWYFKLCTQNMAITIQMVLASVLVQLFSLASPIFYMVIFDRVFGRQNLSTLDVMVYGLYMVPGYNALSAYSIFLEIWAEQGILGLLAFLFLLLTAFARTLVGLYTHGPVAHKLLIGTLFAGILGSVIYGLFDTIWYRPSVNLLFWLMIAGLAVYSEEALHV